MNKIILLSCLLLCCACKHKAQKITAIAKGLIVEGEGHYFSDEADITIKGQEYSLRSKAEYDQQQRFQRLIVYYPEGNLNYESSVLKEDPKFFASFGYPKVNNFRYEAGVVITEDGKKLPVNKVSDTYLELVEGNRVTFFILE